MSIIAARPSRPTSIALWPIALAGLLSAALVAGFAKQLTRGAIAFPADHSGWLALHLCSVIPALPIGAWVLFRRKGDRLHRMLGRVWAVLMMTAAASSFGLHGLMGHLSPIHLLSTLTLFAVPRGVMLAIRGDVAAHLRTMTRVYIGLIGAGAFAFAPGRLMSVWLFG